MKQSNLLLIFFFFLGLQIMHAQPSPGSNKDCCFSYPFEEAVGAPITVSSTATSGGGQFADDVSCSCLAGEGGSTWFSFSCKGAGDLEILITPDHPADFNFSIWAEHCPCQAPSDDSVPFPVICNSAAGTAETGIATDPLASFGVPASAQFSPSVPLVPGTNYFLLVTKASAAAAGFTITLGGTATIEGRIAPPNGGPVQGPSQICVGGTAHFTAPPTFGASSYMWSVTPGNQVPWNGPNPSYDYTFQNVGTYEVCATASGPQLGCFAAAPSCKTVIVSQLPVPAGYEFGTVCSNSEYVAGNGDVFFFGGTFDLHYDSYYGCDSIVRLTLQQRLSDFNITVKEVCPGECVTWGGNTYCDTGNYDDVQQNQYGCDSTNQLLLIVVPLETKINGAANLDCNHPSVTLNSTGSIFSANAVFTWKKNNTVVGTGPTLTVTSGGTYTLSIVSAVGDHFCTISKSVVITQDFNVPQGVTAVGGNANCYTTDVTLMGSSTTPGVTYSWTGPNGFTSNLQNPTVSTQGNYILTVTGTNGCTKTATAVVSENKVQPTVVAIANGTINCNAPTIQLNGAGSSIGGQYSYQWTTTNGNITMDGNTLTPTVNLGGTYVLTVTNSTNGCTNTATVTVIQRLPVSTQVTNTMNVSCFGGANGTASIVATGGDGNYSYSWSNSANTASLTNLTNGNYTVVVTDGNGCTSSQTVTITQPANLLPNGIATAQTIFGVDDGTATANPSGGTSGYSYMWSNGQTTQTISDLAPANYTVVVTDANGCTASQTVTVSAVACAVSASTDQTDVSCPGAADGSATVTLINGNAPFTYAWSNGGVTQTITGLAGGTYNVSVSDIAGCNLVSTVVITEPQPLAANASHTNLTSFQSNDGTATANPNGGTSPYTYLWDNGETTSSITGLMPGTYTIVVTDDHDCTSQQTISISPYNCSFGASIILGEISCNGAGDGQATFSLVGGNGPFNYAWSNGGTTATITGLSAGTYIGTATDAAGCPAIAEATLTNPTALGVDVLEMIEAKCGASDGTLTVMGLGGTPDYTYLWQTGGEMTPTITGINAGTYTVAITDANGCSNSFDIVLGTDDGVPPVVVTQNITIQLDANGQATVIPEDVDNGSSDDCQISSYSLNQTDFDCTDLGANTVTLSVTDIGNNVSTGTAIITVEESIPPTIHCPADILVGGCNAMADFVVTADDNCGGNVTIAQTAGLPSGSNFPLGNSAVSFSATDLSGNTSTCSFMVTVQSNITLTITKTDVTCFNENDGTATANPLGGLPPISYLWSNGDDTQTTTGLVAGTYSVVITDGGGCSATQSVTITQPTNLSTALVNIMNSINNAANGSIDVTVSGGTSPYTFVWKNSTGQVIASTEDIAGLLPGTYTLLVTDANGCQSPSGYTVQNDVATNESALNSHVLLYPNPTLGEVTLELVDLFNYGSVEVTAFDITGREMLHTVNSNSKQLLDFKTKPSGVYVLKIMIGGDVLTKRLVVSK